MIARVYSSILQGIDAVGCEVEADVSNGTDGDVKLVGMAEAAVPIFHPVEPADFDPVRVCQNPYAETTARDVGFQLPRPSP